MATAARLRSGQTALPFDKFRDLGNADSGTDIGKYEGPVYTHAACIAIHHFQTGTDERGQVDLVDYTLLTQESENP